MFVCFHIIADMALVTLSLDSFSFHFHLMRTQKHKILSIIVLNMAKYTIVSLILTDFVPIFFIFNLFQRIFRGRGSTHFNKVQSSKKFQPR